MPGRRPNVEEEEELSETIALAMQTCDPTEIEELLTRYQDRSAQSTTRALRDYMEQNGRQDDRGAHSSRRGEHDRRETNRDDVDEQFEELLRQAVEIFPDEADGTDFAQQFEEDMRGAPREVMVEELRARLAEEAERRAGRGHGRERSHGRDNYGGRRYRGGRDDEDDNSSYGGHDNYDSSDYSDSEFGGRRGARYGYNSEYDESDDGSYDLDDDYEDDYYGSYGGRYGGGYGGGYRRGRYDY
ncbi:hypothetical protein P7C71_g4935, partial [Lecanoromycetidae sp. Uapishka_2]